MISHDLTRGTGVALPAPVCLTNYSAIRVDHVSLLPQTMIVPRLSCHLAAMESANLMFAARQRVSSESLVSSYGSCRSLLLRHTLIRPRSQPSIPSIPSTTLSVPHTFPYIESLAGLLLGMKTATAGTSGAVPHRVSVSTDLRRAVGRVWRAERPGRAG